MGDLAFGNPKPTGTTAVITSDHINRAANHFGNQKAFVDLGNQRITANGRIFDIKITGAR